MNIILTIFGAYVGGAALFYLLMSRKAVFHDEIPLYKPESKEKPDHLKVVEGQSAINDDQQRKSA